MANTVVGVDIDDRAIRAVEVRGASKPSAQIVRLAYGALPAGAVRAGEVIETGTVTEALQQLWRLAKFGTRDVALGIDGNKVFVRDIALPRAPISRIKETLPFTVQDMIPIPVADAILDFYPSGEEVAEDGPVVRGVLVAAAKDAVRALVSSAVGAKLSPVALDLGSFADARVHEPAGFANGIAAIVRIGFSSTNITITERGVPQFVRILGVGDDDITSGIVKRLGVQPAQAQLVKDRYGVDAANVAQSDRQLIEAVYASTWDLLAGIRDTVTYFTGSRAGIRLDRLELTGHGARFPGFDAILADLVKTPVQRASIVKSVKIAKQAEAPPGTSIDDFATAYGLALGARR